MIWNAGLMSPELPSTALANERWVWRKVWERGRTTDYVVAPAGDGWDYQRNIPAEDREVGRQRGVCAVANR